ncbi:hypothetical protein KIPB_009357, partial [Kipferlia bialata]
KREQERVTTENLALLTILGMMDGDRNAPLITRETGGEDGRPPLPMDTDEQEDMSDVLTVSVPSVYVNGVTDSGANGTDTQTRGGESRVSTRAQRTERGGMRLSLPSTRQSHTNATTHGVSASGPRHGAAATASISGRAVRHPPADPPARDTHTISVRHPHQRIRTRPKASTTTSRTTKGRRQAQLCGVYGKGGSRPGGSGGAAVPSHRGPAGVPPTNNGATGKGATGKGVKGAKGHQVDAPSTVDGDAKGDEGDSMHHSDTETEGSEYSDSDPSDIGAEGGSVSGGGVWSDSDGEGDALSDALSVLSEPDGHTDTDSDTDSDAGETARGERGGDADTVGLAQAIGDPRAPGPSSQDWASYLSERIAGMGSVSQGSLETSIRRHRTQYVQVTEALAGVFGPLPIAMGTGTGTGTGKTGGQTTGRLMSQVLAQKLDRPRPPVPPVHPMHTMPRGSGTRHKYQRHRPHRQPQPQSQARGAQSHSASGHGAGSRAQESRGSRDRAQSKTHVPTQALDASTQRSVQKYSLSALRQCLASPPALPTLHCASPPPPLPPHPSVMGQGQGGASSGDRQLDCGVFHPFQTRPARPSHALVGGILSHPGYSLDADRTAPLPYRNRVARWRGASAAGGDGGESDLSLVSLGLALRAGVARVEADRRLSLLSYLDRLDMWAQRLLTLAAKCPDPPEYIPQLQSDGVGVVYLHTGTGTYLSVKPTVLMARRRVAQVRAQAEGLWCVPPGASVRGVQHDLDTCLDRDMVLVLGAMGGRGGHNRHMGGGTHSSPRVPADQPTDGDDDDALGTDTHTDPDPEGVDRDTVSVQSLSVSLAEWIPPQSDPVSLSAAVQCSQTRVRKAAEAARAYVPVSSSDPPST